MYAHRIKEIDRINHTLLIKKYSSGISTWQKIHLEQNRDTLQSCTKPSIWDWYVNYNVHVCPLRRRGFLRWLLILSVYGQVPLDISRYNIFTRYCIRHLPGALWLSFMDYFEKSDREIPGAHQDNEEMQNNCRWHHVDDWEIRLAIRITLLSPIRYWRCDWLANQMSQGECQKIYITVNKILQLCVVCNFQGLSNTVNAYFHLSIAHFFVFFRLHI